MESPLAPAELKEFSRVNSSRSLGGLVLDWLILFLAALAGYRSSNPLVWFLAWLVIARQQHALAVLMHEACHTRLARSDRVNDWAGQWFCAAPLFFSLAAYRFLHLAHHKAPMAEGDPDLSITGGFPRDRASFFRKITRDLTGRTYPKFIRFYTVVPSKARSGAAWWTRRPRLSGFIANGVLALVMGRVIGPFSYFAFWLPPLFFILPVMLRIRAIIEHAGYGPNADQSLNTRTMAPSWQTAFLAPHNVNYHIEHHLYPSVPFSRLPLLQRELDGRRGRTRENRFSSYPEVIASLIR